MELDSWANNKIKPGKNSLIRFAPFLVLFFGILPLSVLLNPAIITRFLGETSGISEYGYLDLEHYIDIAEEGRREAWQTAFYPLWPYIIRLFNNIYNLDIYKISIFISIAFGIISLLFSKYIFRRLSTNEANAIISWSLYVLSPMSIFLIIGYSESIFAFGSWILIALILNILNRERINTTYLFANAILIVLDCILLGMTRPSLIQAGFSALIALFLSLNSNALVSQKTKKIYLTISISIVTGFLIGYCIYGAICINDGFSFFEPFYAQQFWKKSFGIRPIYFLTSRSPMIDFWGLYYPFLLLISLLYRLQILKTNSVNSILFANLPLTLLYPPIGLIYGVFKFNHSRLAKIELKREHINNVPENDAYLENNKYLFLYSVIFALSHSAICLLTSELYLASLGRFVFGQPYFYIALSIYINSQKEANSRKPKTILMITLFISALMLLKNMIDFGNATLHV